MQYMFENYLLFMCEYSSSNFNWHFIGLDYMKNYFVVLFIYYRL